MKFEEVIPKYKPFIYSVIRRIVHDREISNEIYQEVCIKIWRGIRLFRGDEKKILGWLRVVSTHASINFYCRKSRDASEDEITDEPSEDPKAERGLMSGQLAEELWRKVNMLPDKQRVAVILRVYQDMSFKEVAQYMNCPYNTAKANFLHGIKRLKEWESCVATESGPNYTP